MAGICYGVVSESEGSASSEPSSRAARRRRMEIRRFKFVAGVGPSETTEHGQKRQKVELYAKTSFSSRLCENAVENCDESGLQVKVGKGKSETEEILVSSLISPLTPKVDPVEYPKYGVSSVCGRRRDMEDAVAVHSSLCPEIGTELHYFGVYDGHGCSHVAMRCRDRLHELVKEEFESSREWKNAMERSFTRMDKEAIVPDEDGVGANCRCELRTPDCDAVGSTAVVAIVTPQKIVVANCGDSRAVLSRNGKAIPLSSDHKPDRADELNRIQAAGGRVIYWDGPRVLGVLAMSRAIGDNYLKPYVSCEPEVTVIDRTAEDDCLILASDGLWDVVSNETACGVARMCLKKWKGRKGHASPPPVSAVEDQEEENEEEREGVGSPSKARGGDIWDKTCTDASTLLTKLALARHSTDNVSVVVVDLRRDT